MSGREKPWLTANEAAARLRIHPKTLYGLIKAGKVRAYRMGARGEWRLRPEDVDAALKAYVPWVHRYGPTVSIPVEFAASAREEG